jgi:flagellar biogenesis protein FliO
LTGDGWWKTMGALTVALALVFLTAKVLRRTVPAVRTALPDGVVQVLGRKVLDYRHTIHLVRFGSRMLILGTSQEGMRTLSEITDPVEIDYLAGLCKISEPASISDTFGQLFQRFQNPGTTPDIAGLDVGAELGTDAPAEPEPDADPAILRLQRRLHPTAGAERDRGASPSTEAAG